jgi:outer membrane lipoprotein-sorting protein
MRLMLLWSLLIPDLGFSKSFLPSSFSSTFEESSVSYTGKEIKNLGKIDYQYPGNIRLEYTSASPSTIVVNPNQTWYYTPKFDEKELAQVTIKQSGEFYLIKFLDAIKDDITSSKIFEPKYDGKELIFHFNQDQKDLSLKQVILHGKKEAKTIDKMEDFEKMTLVHADGKKVSLRFLELKENVKFPESHFVFKVPPKTKITNN